MKACQMILGKLVSHPCGSPIAGRCATCGRGVCAHHLGGNTCLQCLGRYTPPHAPLAVSEGELMAFDAEEIAAFDQAGPHPAHYHGDS